MIDQLDEHDLGHLVKWEGVPMPLPCFLIRQMWLSTSGTCSFAAVVFKTRMGIRALSFSNLLSISTVPPWNPLCEYRSMMRLIPVASCLAVRDGVCSAVTHLCLVRC